jgi:hypothetical protein
LYILVYNNILIINIKKLLYPTIQWMKKNLITNLGYLLTNKIVNKLSKMNLDNFWNLLEIAVEDTLNPSSKDMRAFKDKVFELWQTHQCNPSKLNLSKCNSNLLEKKIRKAHNLLPNEQRCEALIYDLELNNNNQLEPARCKRSMLDNSKFCKQHGAVDGTKNIDDSAHFGKDVIHEFKWGHLGTINNPSYMFEQSNPVLLKRYAAKNKIVNSESKDEVNEVKLHKSQIKKEKLVKPKRTIANAFITYKSDNFADIKNSILANGANITGRDLVVAITKEASHKWKSISEDDKLIYKQKALANKSAMSKPVTLLITTDNEDDQVAIPIIEDSDDESTLVFNPTLQVWVDTDNNLCYETKDNTISPCGQLQRGKMTNFPKKL